MNEDRICFITELASANNEIDAKNRPKKEMIAGFEKLLNSYAKSRKLPYVCHGMDFVKGAVLTLVEKKANEVLPDNVLVALAGVAGVLGTAEFTSLCGDDISRKELKKLMSDVKKEAINDSASWLATNSRESLLNSGKNQRVFTHKSAANLLRQLLDEYFPPEPENVTV